MGRFIEHVRFPALHPDPIIDLCYYPLVSYKYSFRRVSLFIFYIFFRHSSFSQSCSILGGSKLWCACSKYSHLVSSHSGGCSWRPRCSAGFETDAEKCSFVRPRILCPSVGSMLLWDRRVILEGFIFVPAEECIKQCVKNYRLATPNLELEEVQFRVNVVSSDGRYIIMQQWYICQTN